MNPNFEFSSPSTTKLGSENPTISSLSSLSKPRMLKSRKSVNPRSIGSSGTQKIDPGFNPFRPVLDNLSGVSSRLEGEDFGDGAFLNRNKHLNVKVTDTVEKAGNALLDEIRRLNIESQADSRAAGRVANNFNGKGSANLSSIQEPSKGVDSGLPPELSDDMRRLNIRGLHGENRQISGVDSFGGLHEATVGCGGQSVGGFFGTTLASELPNDLRKLNLKDSGEATSHNFVFSATARSDSVFCSSRKSNDVVASGITSTLPDKIKTLNVEDSDGTNGAQKELNVNKNNQRFDYGKIGTGSVSGGAIDPMILNEIERLNIEGHSAGSRSHTDLDNSSSPRKESHGSMSKEDGGKSTHTRFTSLFSDLGKHSSGTHVSQDQSNKGSEQHCMSSLSMSSLPSSGLHFQPLRDEFQVPCLNEPEKKSGFGVSFKEDCPKVPPFEFKTSNPKGNLFTGSNQKIEFSAKKGSVKGRARKGKLKEPIPVQSFEKSFSSKENDFNEYSDPSECSSPMDVSPYREIPDDKQSGRETSLMSDNQTSTAQQAVYSDDAMDEELARATECMDINKNNDLRHDEANVQVSDGSVNSCVATAGSLENPVFVTETESFRSASENLERNEENEVESDGEVQSCHTQYFSASSSRSTGGLSFTFAASSSAQSQGPPFMRYHRKKNRTKPGSEIYNSSITAGPSDASSSLQFSPMSRASVLPSLVEQKDISPAAPQKKSTVGNNLEDTKRETTSPTVASRAAQEACEKWRLRGNQAYSSGDLEKAEDYYTQGLSCVPQNETSRDCLRALVLCYSNRAAARMSVGRMRDALRDCLVAVDIDPKFFRVQLRAANCYLALGEVGDASRYFKKLLQSNDVCVERKLILEASDGIQKVQTVSECMDRSAEFLLQRTFTDVESALGFIADALVISPYSEQLLERKAAVFFMLRRYEEVIQLCMQTLDAAEKNTPLFDADGRSSNLDASEILKSYSFRIWRYSHIFRSNFYLGKLEEALDFLEKQEQWRSMGNKYGNETLESLIPQVATARQLIHHKSAGNEAFQAGRQTEAVEHYTAALSFSVESRPFAAVCFGNRAAAFQALGQVSDAIADCSLAIALDGNYLKAISRRATLFEMIRDYEQAAKDLERLVSLLNKQAEEKANHLGASLPVNSLSDLRHARQRLHQMEEQARKGIPLDFYLILGIEPSVTAADLKKAYRKAALRHHPDKAGQSLTRSDSGDDRLWKEIAEEVYKDADKLFKMIGEAYAVLSNPTKRSQYDIEEEMRNGQRKSSASSASRMHTDAPFYERSGSSGRQWRDVGRSTANPYFRGFEPTRSSRYY